MSKITVDEFKRRLAVLCLRQGGRGLPYTPKFRRLIEAADRRIKETGGIKHEEFWEFVEKEMGTNSL